MGPGCRPFDSLLTALHGDRATAAAEYERMRLRLIRFFSIQQARSPEDLTDTRLTVLHDEFPKAKKSEMRNSIFLELRGCCCSRTVTSGDKRNMRCGWWRMRETIHVPTRAARDAGVLSGGIAAEEQRTFAAVLQCGRPGADCGTTKDGGRDGDGVERATQPSFAAEGTAGGLYSKARRTRKKSVIFRGIRQ